MTKIICIISILSCFITIPGLSEAAYSKKTTENEGIIYRDSSLFSSDDLFEITLKFDISNLKKIRSDTNYVPGVITYRNGISDSEIIDKEIKIKTRGNFRRTYCDLPPLTLMLNNKDTSNGIFKGIKKVKLATYCRKGDQDYVLTEYLIYRLYNILTDNSLRVRLLKINYINTSRNTKPVSEYGFFIEPVALFEKRTKSIEVKRMGLNQNNIKPEMMDRVAIFNYMIGNTDWSISNLHNVKVFSQGLSENPELGMIVPYDFDYSGMVNTDYAVPFDGLHLNSVRDRRYLGACRDKQVFINDLKEYSLKEEEFYRVINEFPYLDKYMKKSTLEYLNEFFKGIKYQDKVVEDMLAGCIHF
jgi:hypothetical protein